MRRKTLFAVALCLVVVAALAIGAAPALAADGCAACHTTPPTGDAPAAHAPYVASVTDCATCHVGMTEPHAGLGGQVMQLSKTTDSSGLGLVGRLGSQTFGNPFIPHPDVAVYLQQRLWGATEFTDLANVITDAGGGFAYTLSPGAVVPYALYRVVTAGWVGPKLTFMPAKRSVKPTPELTVRLWGGVEGGYWTPASLWLGRSTTVKGTVKPEDVGGKVTIRVQKRVNHKWVTRITRTRAISDAGTYSWKWTPKTRGKFRVDARIPATATHKAVWTGHQKIFGWGWFNVI